MRTPHGFGALLGAADEVMGRSQRPMVVTCTLYQRLMHSLLTNRRPTRAGRTRGEMALTRTALRKIPECAGSPGNNANRVEDVEAALVPHRFSRRGLQAPAVKSFTGQGGCSDRSGVGASYATSQCVAAVTSVRCLNIEVGPGRGLAKKRAVAQMMTPWQRSREKKNSSKIPVSKIQRKPIA